MQGDPRLSSFTATLTNTINHHIAYAFGDLAKKALLKWGETWKTRYPEMGKWQAFGLPLIKGYKSAPSVSGSSTYTCQEELVFAEIQKLLDHPHILGQYQAKLFCFHGHLISQTFFLHTCSIPLTINQSEVPQGGPQGPQMSSIPQTSALPKGGWLAHPPVHSLLTELAASGSFLFL